MGMLSLYEYCPVCRKAVLPNDPSAFHDYRVYHAACREQEMADPHAILKWEWRCSCGFSHVSESSAIDNQESIRRGAKCPNCRYPLLEPRKIESMIVDDYDDIARRVMGRPVDMPPSKEAIAYFLDVYCALAKTTTPTSESGRVYVWLRSLSE